MIVNKFRYKKDESGLTLVELVVAITLSSIAIYLMMTATIYVYGHMNSERSKSEMIRNSQILLTQISNDLRVGDRILSTGVLADPNSPAGGWVTSDPADTLIVSIPVTDRDGEFVIDPVTGNPYQHEAVYFNDDDTMFKRIIISDDAITAGGVQSNSCPTQTALCRKDNEITPDVESLLFTFYDGGGVVVTDATQAKSILVTINLKKRVYGRDLFTTNSARITLRNGN